MRADTLANRTMACAVAPVCCVRHCAVDQIEQILSLRNDFFFDVTEPTKNLVPPSPPSECPSSNGTTIVAPTRLLVCTPGSFHSASCLSSCNNVFMTFSKTSRCIFTTRIQMATHDAAGADALWDGWTDTTVHAMYLSFYSIPSSSPFSIVFLREQRSGRCQ